MTAKHFSLSLGLALAAVQPVFGQGLQEQPAELVAERNLDTRNLPEGILDVTRSGAGITEDAGVLWGLGNAYKASFTNNGMEFTPALGENAPHNFPLRFTLQSIRRGNQIVHDAVNSSPVKAERAGELLVQYPRGAGIRETYEMRPDGIKHNFVFDAEPRGDGDLVVRGRIDTELVADFHGETADGLTFLAEGLGGVRIGAVTGIDANGWSVPGSLRFDGEEIEFVLPANLVDQAAYPLTLDPLVGPEFLVGTTTARNTDPEVAFEETIDQYMVVWERTFSASDVDIRAALINADGTVGTGLIGITITLDVDLNPSVASSDLSNDFYVVWQRGPSAFGPWDIYGRNYDTSASALSPELALANSASNEITPDVGGDATTFDDRVQVVWHKVGSGIQTIWVDQQGSGAVFTGSIVDLTSDPDDSNPKISKSGGSAGRWVVAFERAFSSTDHDIWAIPMGRNSAILGSAHNIDFSSNNETVPDVDGDGTAFLVVYQRDEPGGNDRNVLGRVVSTTGGNLSNVTGTLDIAANANDDEAQPAVGFLGVKFLVVFADEFSGLDYDIGIVELSRDGRFCGNRTASVAGPLVDFEPEVASRFSGRAGQTFTGNSNQDQALFVHHSGGSSPPFDMEIRGRLFESIGSGGAVTNLGGACGNGGTNGFNGPVALGNSALRLTLTGAAPGAAFMAVGIDFVNATNSCGPCTSMNTNNWFIVFPSGPGSASYPLGIPCDNAFQGLPIYTQWAVFLSGVNPCFLVPPGAQLSFSNRLRSSIGS